MQQPVVRIAENLRWTRSGVVWADYLLTGLDYGYRPSKDKRTVRAMHKMLCRALPGDWRLLGLCVSLDPAAIVDRMIAGIDLNQHDQWARECDATWDTLEQLRPGDRVYWLSIPLSNRGWQGQLKAAKDAAMVSLGDALSMPRGPLPAAELERRREQARKAVSDVPAIFEPTPATAAQMVWLHGHCASRGLSLDRDIPPAVDEPVTIAPSALSPLRIDEGAQADRIPTEDTADSGFLTRALARGKDKLPNIAPVIKVDQPWRMSPASYQSFVGLSGTPSGDSVFPGSEIFDLADDLPDVDVDWGICATSRARTEVLQKNHRALVNLNDQYLQREQELSTGVSALDMAAAAMADYSTELESDQQEVEVEASILFAIGSDTEDKAVSAAGQLAKLFEDSGYELQSPLGLQEQMFWSMYPGAPTQPVVKEFAQVTTSKHFSAYVPLTRAHLGTATGPVMALNITTNRIGVVHHDTAGVAEADLSPSLAVAAELGGGKSVLLKSRAGDEVDRGAQLLVTDRTAVGEYEIWAKSITDAVVVDCVAPKYSLDPLRMFPITSYTAADREAGRKSGPEIAENLLLGLLNLAPDEDEGLLLSALLDPEVVIEYELHSLPALVAYVTGKCDDPAAARLGKMLNVFASKSYAAALFSPDMPALNPDAPAIVIRTHGLELPREQEIDKPQLFRNLPLDKRVGRAMYRHIAEIARGICFRDPSQLGLWVLDECHHITRNDEGAEIIADFVRDGRKHNAAVFLGSHDPEADFGSATLRSLIKYRIVMRQTDRDLARKSLRWLRGGVEPTEDLLTELTENTSPATGPNNHVDEWRRGEGYMRDGSGSIGRIKVLLPSDPERAKAVKSTPKRHQEVDELVHS